MPRMISFSMTEPQFIDGSKDVTRRMGWKRLRAGDRLIAVRKAMGLKAGEKVHRLGMIEVISVRREPLWKINADECRREGFPEMTPVDFMDFFCKGHRGCSASSIVTRIEFRRAVEEESNAPR